jgi:arsenate reductase
VILEISLDKNKEELSRFSDAKKAGLYTVLFICTGNAVRSQMAEALVNHFLGGKWAAFSAGIMPMEINKNVIVVLGEIGVDISDKKTKSIELFYGCNFDLIITLCSDADKLCTIYPTDMPKIHMPFRDPTISFFINFTPLSDYRNLRDEMMNKIVGFLKEVE